MMHTSHTSAPKVLSYRPFRRCSLRKSRPATRCSGKGFGEKVAPKKEKKAQKPPKQPSVPEKQPGPAPPAADLSLQPTSRNGQNSRRRSESEEIQEVPEVINQRLLNRMLTFSLIPVFLGFVSLPLLAYIQVIRMLTFSRIPVFLGFVSLTLLAYIQVVLKVDLPTGTAFTVSGLFFGVGLLGITYGIFSASWDENEQGTGLGLKEFKTNTAPFVEKVKNKLK